ncbi:HNH endonuclease [Weissella cibaria]|uniref:HNH endonuclease n=1 Tax=Weissella cibaria TaxID=137591 RepID=A0A9Q8N8X1_9LACO|nr:HNH endonuclease [Weissella cibaria]TVV27040.1 HNH endonuclease [Weissella cibaria]TVV40238.1 HNH endonuclease [Weissella cibaria]
MPKKPVHNLDISALHDGFYNTKQWKKISAYVKSRDGYADAINGRLWDEGDLIVDHIIPRRLLPKDKHLDTSNLWLLTRAQHNHKTSVEKKLSENVLKHASREWWGNVLREKLFYIY